MLTELSNCLVDLTEDEIKKQLLKAINVYN